LVPAGTSTKPFVSPEAFTHAAENRRVVGGSPLRPETPSADAAIPVHRAPARFPTVTEPAVEFPTVEVGSDGGTGGLDQWCAADQRRGLGPTGRGDRPTPATPAGDHHTREQQPDERRD